MQGIKVRYSTDRESWTDNEFEDQEDKEFLITWDMISELLRQNANFEDDERLDSIEDIKIIR
jgi:hypothetical protein